MTRLGMGKHGIIFIVSMSALGVGSLVALDGFEWFLISPTAPSERAAGNSHSTLPAQATWASRSHRPPRLRSGAESPLANDTNTSPPDVITTLAGIAHVVTRRVDDLGQVCLGLSRSEENAIGDSVHRRLLQEHRVLPEPSVRLQQLAEVILEYAGRDRRDFTFTALDTPELNAFSHVGGHIYFHRGLLEAATTDIEVMFVLAHEIAHVELGHCSRAVTYAKRAGDSLGDAGEVLSSLAYSAISRGYSEDQEFDADEWAYRVLRQEGFDHQQCLSFFAKLANLESASTGTEKQEHGSIARSIGEHFRTHPPTRLRILRLDAIRER